MSDFIYLFVSRDLVSEYVRAHTPTFAKNMENIFNLLQIKLESEKKINFLKKIFSYFYGQHLMQYQLKLKKFVDLSFQLKN